MINETCAALIRDAVPDKLAGMIPVWISAREFKRAKQGEQAVASLDKAFADAVSKVRSGDEASAKVILKDALGADCTQFQAKVITMITLGLPTVPGWSDADCRCDWTRFACVMYSLALMSQDDLTTYVGKVNLAKPDTSFLPCAVKWPGDTVYNCDWPMPGEACKDPDLGRGKPINWFAWTTAGLIGVGAVGTFFAFRAYNKRDVRIRT